MSSLYSLNLFLTLNDAIEEIVVFMSSIGLAFVSETNVAEPCPWMLQFVTYRLLSSARRFGDIISDNLEVV